MSDLIQSRFMSQRIRPREETHTKEVSVFNERVSTTSRADETAYSEKPFSETPKLLKSFSFVWATTRVAGEGIEAFVRDQSGNNNTMKASSTDNQGYEIYGNFLNGEVSSSSQARTSNTFDSSSSYDPPNAKNHFHCSIGVGENLRKRSFVKATHDLALSSCNSAFLSGLFADIAEANRIQNDLRIDQVPNPRKKSRISMTRSISRCEKSFANLHMVGDKVNRINPVSGETAESSSTPIERDNSLTYQLHCVSSASSNESDTLRVTNFGLVAFPHLPATISNSSCDHLAKLTRRHSDQLMSDSETDPKESYGWFVNFDEDDECILPLTYAARIPFSSSSSICDLAFSTSIAPKRSSQHDAEVAWARAADTVDDVLGDFF